MHFVESRGSGFVKVVIELENELLPAPDIISKENYTVMYNYLISDTRNYLGVWCERKQHIK